RGTDDGGDLVAESAQMRGAHPSGADQCEPHRCQTLSKVSDTSWRLLTSRSPGEIVALLVERCTRDRLRVGVVGCGLVAQVMHLHYLGELSDLFEVGAVCDVAPEALERAGRLFPEARRHRDWQDVVADELDAVLVLTPGSHAP